MGEISEMVEMGILCQECGVYLNIDEEYGDDQKFNGTGHFTTCSECFKQREIRG